MPAPTRAELQQALLEIRQAAERLKSYEPRLLEQLQSALGTHLPTVGRATDLPPDLPPDLRARCERIAIQGKTVTDSMERARQHPTQFTARADVLDRTGRLAKKIRDLLAKLGAPPA